MLKKPKKFGIKLWVLCEALSGYCLQFQIYRGKSDDGAERGLAYRVVFDLLSSYLNKNHHVYFDNFYTSCHLIYDLQKKSTYSCGTVRADRGQFLDNFKKAKLEKCESLFIQKGNIVGVHWKDKRDVFVMTSLHSNEVVEVERRNGTSIIKPKAVLEYNKYMGGVDKCNQYLSYYSVGRRSMKWWKRLFFRILEIAIINATVIFMERNPAFKKRKQSHKLFREMLLHEMFQPLLDGRSDGLYTNGIGRKPVIHDERLKGKSK